MSPDSTVTEMQQIRPTAGYLITQAKRGVRTHVLLVAAVALIIAGVTSVSLLIVRDRLHAQVTDDLSNELVHSVATFQDLQTERLSALERENALLADLPSLKALMTTSDDRTIQNGAVEFWDVSGNDLFALAGNNGRVVAAYTKNSTSPSTLRSDLEMLLTSPEKSYLVSGGHLFGCSIQPLYFGSKENGTLLGYVISGFSIDQRMVGRISQPTGIEATFLSGGQSLASTLEPALQKNFVSQLGSFQKTPSAPFAVRIGTARYLVATKDLSANATSPLQLVFLKSFDPAERSIRRINRLVLIAGLLALLLGVVLMVLLSRLVTRPLEELAEGVRAFGVGDDAYRIPRYGTQEVRQLSAAFASMRGEIQQANHALIESERLATIGRMASSVSHDLRHYLAAVYANAEFLASDRLSPQERAEIFADVRTAVLGTTEMIESLLIFSRTSTVQRSPELVAALLERAIAMIRSHPDAEGVALMTEYEDPTETAVVVDGKQIERAIYNLLLNACQSARIGGNAAEVKATIEVREREVVLNVLDNGAGVPEGIRRSLFEPFVSEGKQKGTGLGLTLAHTVAAEHGGEVVLLSSSSGKTIFQMKLIRDSTPQTSVDAADHDKVMTR